MFPTDIGVVVNEFLVGHFDNILDYGFMFWCRKGV